MTRTTELDDPALTIPAALECAAEEYDGDLAVVDGRQRLSFVELQDLSTRVACALIGDGILPGDRVAIWAPNSWLWVAASFGVYAAGAVLVPVNTRFKDEEAAHVLRRSGARLILTVTDFLDSDFVSMIQGRRDLGGLSQIVVLHGSTRPGTIHWNDWLDRGRSVEISAALTRRRSVQPDSISDIIFTSGTTGAPKGAVLTHGSSTRTYSIWSERVGLRRGDRYLVVYPFFHTAGLKSGILASLLTGSTIYPFPIFDVPAMMECVAQERITMLPGPPTVFQSILNHPELDRFDLSSLRLSVTGATTVPVEVVRRMREDLCIETVVTGYGLTETTGTVSMCSHDDAPEVIASTVGRPLPGVTVKVVDDAGTTLDVGQPGQILVRGFNVMKGYFDDVEATRAAIDAAGWLATGDIGVVDAAGNIRITDRKKDMYISGGFNVYPAEVERIIARHRSVAQVAVVGTPDERMGEVGAAFVVLRHDQPWEQAGFLDWCRDNMANFKVPRSVEVLDELPLNSSGKVMKYLLRDGKRKSLDHPVI